MKALYVGGVPDEINRLFVLKFDKAYYFAYSEDLYTYEDEAYFMVSVYNNTKFTDDEVYGDSGFVETAVKEIFDFILSGQLDKEKYK